MSKNYTEKICEYYYNSRGRRIIANYEKFYHYVTKHGDKNLALYAEWYTEDHIVITCVSAFYNSKEQSVVKINRETL